MSRLIGRLGGKNRTILQFLQTLDHSSLLLFHFFLRWEPPFYKGNLDSTKQLLLYRFTLFMENEAKLFLHQLKTFTIIRNYNRTFKHFFIQFFEIPTEKWD